MNFKKISDNHYIVSNQHEVVIDIERDVDGFFLAYLKEGFYQGHELEELSKFIRSLNDPITKEFNRHLDEIRNRNPNT
jgi:hypothetical protein